MRIHGPRLEKYKTYHISFQIVMTFVWGEMGKTSMDDTLRIFKPSAILPLLKYNIATSVCSFIDEMNIIID